MSALEVGLRRVPRRWSVNEKRRIVELSHLEGASINAIAREHGLHASVVSQWRKLYREGKLSAASLRGDANNSAPATFLPVKIPSRNTPVASSSRDLLEVALPCGIVVRIETPGLSAQLLCTLLAQLQR